LTAGSFEYVSNLPFISPTFPPSFDTKGVEPMPLENSKHSTLNVFSSLTSSITAKSAPASSIGTAATIPRTGYFLDETTYNKISIGDTGRTAEL
jgi:hypothetical protein